MLLQLCQLYLFSFFLDLFRLCLLDWIPIVKSVISCVGIDVVATFRLSLAIVVNSEKASLDLFSIHLHQGVFRTLMRLKLNVGEAFRLFSLPIIRDSNRLNLSKSTEPISDVVFLEGVGQSLDEECFAVARHQASHFYRE